jgi:hypothetical protein
MLGRQSLDDVFKHMCSSRAFIEKLEKNIGKKPDYAALRKLQDDPDFNELSDHVFSMLTPLADSEESALCCILRMRESELRVLQQLHSKLQSSDSSKFALETDIGSRRKIVEILKYALKLNQQENLNGVPLTIEDPSAELDTDAANMCQRIVQRRLNFLELIADGSVDSAQRHNVSFETQHSSINQRLAEAAKNVERSLNSLGSNSDLSIRDLDCPSTCAIVPRPRDAFSSASGPVNEALEHASTSSIFASHDVLDKSVSVVDTFQGNRFDLKCSDTADTFSQTYSDSHVSSPGTDQSTTLSHKFEVMTAIPRKSRPILPLSTANISSTIARTISSRSGQRSQSDFLLLSDSSNGPQRAMKTISPFAMVKQPSSCKDSISPLQLGHPFPGTSRVGNVDTAAVDAVIPLENSFKSNDPPLRKSDIQPSPHKIFNSCSPVVLEANTAELTDKIDNLESYCQSKATVLKIRKSSIGSFPQSPGANGHSPIRYIYADLVHASNGSPSGGGRTRTSPSDVVVTRPHIASLAGSDAIRSPRKYEAQMNRLRSSSVGRSPLSEPPLFRESYFPVMRQGSHLELRSPNDRFNAASVDKKPLGWV